MVQHDQAVGLDGIVVEVDDQRAVADAGIVLTATLAKRLGIEVPRIKISATPVS
jgi:hypothetical protein